MPSACKRCGKPKGEPFHRRLFSTGARRWECKLVPVEREGRTVWMSESDLDNRPPAA